MFVLSASTTLVLCCSVCCVLIQTQGPGSPRSSPSHTISRQIPTPILSDSTCTTPTHTPQDSLMGVGGDVQEAFAQGSTVSHKLMSTYKHFQVCSLTNISGLFQRSEEKFED